MFGHLSSQSKVGEAAYYMSQRAVPTNNYLIVLRRLAAEEARAARRPCSPCIGWQGGGGR
jgi:hypothetical protein